MVREQVLVQERVQGLLHLGLGQERVQAQERVQLREQAQRHPWER